MDGTELYNRYLGGDGGALEALVEKYSDSLVGYAYCYLHDFFAAEDVMEDVFAVLIVKRKRFTANAPFEAYLFKIARNKCIDRLRKLKRETGLDEYTLEADCDIAADALKSVRDEKIYRALMSLPRDYRDVLYLAYYQGFSVEEIRSARGKNKKQVYNLLARAKAALKQILVKEGIGYEDL